MSVLTVHVIFSSQASNSLYLILHLFSLSMPSKASLLQLSPFSDDKENKRPTGFNGHQSIRDFTLNSCQKGAYLHINSPIIIINKNQQLYRKAAS